MSDTVGVNRRFDTPIGGSPEFRANVNDVPFSVGDVPVYDGDSFAPGANAASVYVYGGLALEGGEVRVADGTVIDGWSVVTPLSGTPLQCTPDPITGIITVDQNATYRAAFSCNIGGLANNQDYFFEFAYSGGGTGFGSHIVGSNNVSSQSTSFELMTAGTVGGQLAVLAHSTGDRNYTITSMSLSVEKVGA